LITTTKATLAAHKQRVPWEALPKTFKEAVEATHGLGVKYLWIDSLCIVQDDVDDWRREGSKMGAIYRSSYLTVAAASSHDSSGGLFATSPPECSPQKIGFEDSESCMFVRAKDSPCHSQYTPPAHKMKRLPLLSRAWTFQEMLLAPRVALFVADEIIWLCPSLKTCECSSPLDPIFAKPSFLTLSPASAPVRALQWRSTVEQYTRRYMTFEKDIFPALSGLANLFASQGEEPAQYLAGVWQNSLVEDLLWCNQNGIDDDWRASGRPAVWRAPSWSWAAIRGIVRWNRNREFNCVARANATVERAGVDVFGELESATLWLTAPSVELHLADSEGKLASLPDLLEYAVKRDHRFNHCVQKYAYQDYGLSGGQRLVVGCDGTIYLALMATEYRESVNSFWCMVLLCVDGERRLYERIGLLDLWEEKRRDDLGPFNGALEREFTVV
ncbi:HET-domain-containing protein, partial [Lophiostoma macrostomum CBS 122681]